MAPKNSIPTIQLTEVPIPKKNVSEIELDTLKKKRLQLLNQQAIHHLLFIHLCCECDDIRMEFRDDSRYNLIPRLIDLIHVCDRQKLSVVNTWTRIIEFH